MTKRSIAIFHRASRMAAIFAGFLLAAGSAGAQQSPTLLETGTWIDDTGAGAVEIYICNDRNDRLCGRIVWLKEPLNAEGVPKHDRYNPTASLQSRPICGLPILGNLAKLSDGGFDNGWIYDPKAGKSYSAAIQLQQRDRLVVTGYLGMRFMGKSFTWTRAPADLPRCNGAPGAAQPINGAKSAAPPTSGASTASVPKPPVSKPAATAAGTTAGTTLGTPPSTTAGTKAPTSTTAKAATTAPAKQVTSAPGSTATGSKSTTAKATTMTAKTATAAKTTATAKTATAAAKPDAKSATAKSADGKTATSKTASKTAKTPATVASTGTAEPPPPKAPASKPSVAAGADAMAGGVTYEDR